jgi:hypothetical protein
MTDNAAFREALANTPGRPLDDFPIPGLPTDPDECMLHLWSLSDQARRRNPEWVAERDALTAQFVADTFGPWSD